MSVTLMSFRSRGYIAAWVFTRIELATAGERIIALELATSDNASNLRRGCDGVLKIRGELEIQSLGLWVPRVYAS
jgi:hypothetical protein